MKKFISINKVKEFLRLESASGILLMVAVLLAMAIENSPGSVYYEALLRIPIEIKIHDLEIAKPLLLWINDGLMAIFFLLIGLEIKREFLAGELSEPSQVVLPVIGAVGGMAIPAIIYTMVNWGDAAALKGWAIPAATDIAFALGVLALLGNRVPQSLKIFLMTLAIIDDLGAVVIIAIFYTADLSLTALGIALLAVVGLFILNRRGVLNLIPYFLIGLVLWVAVLKSGVHATLAGVILAFFIPFKSLCDAEPKLPTQLEKLEHDIHPVVAYAILPIFAFMNSGVSFAGFTIDDLLHPVPLGITAGLFIGKQLGVFGFSWLAIKLGLTKLPKEYGWLQLYGVAMLCGIGFTMSLFIASLAFESGAIGVDDRPGILLGSLISGVIGYIILRFFTKPRHVITKPC